MKCTLCEKEFPENTTDFEFFLHMIQNHRDEVKKTAKNIKEELGKVKNLSNSKVTQKK